jgi:hypothetical protein
MRLPSGVFYLAKTVALYVMFTFSALKFAPKFQGDTGTNLSQDNSPPGRNPNSVPSIYGAGVTIITMRRLCSFMNMKGTVLSGLN